MQEQAVQDTEEQVATEATTGEAESTPELDYKAISESQGTQISKLENDLRSRDGQVEGNQRLVSRLERIESQLVEYKKSNDVYKEAFASGEMEGVPAEIARVEAEAEQAVQTQETRSGAARLRGTLDNLAKSVGIDLSDPVSSPFDSVRNAWNSASDKNDIVGLSDALGEAITISDKMKEERRQETQTSERNAAVAQARQQTAQDLEANDLDVGTGSGGGSGSDRQLEADVASGAIAMTPRIQARLDKYWNS